MTDECRATVWNLLLFSEDSPSLFAPAFIQELERTRKCKDFTRVEYLRKCYEKKLGKETYDKIVAHETDSAAFEKAASVVTHYSTLNKELVRKELGPVDTCYFWIRKPFAALGLVEKTGTVECAKSGWQFLNNKKHSC